jgi:hypothetical protein
LLIQKNEARVVQRPERAVNGMKSPTDFTGNIQVEVEKIIVLLQRTLFFFKHFAENEFLDHAVPHDSRP